MISVISTLVLIALMIGAWALTRNWDDEANLTPHDRKYIYLKDKYLRDRKGRFSDHEEKQYFYSEYKQYSKTAR